MSLTPTSFWYRAFWDTLPQHRWVLQGLSRETRATLTLDGGAVEYEMASAMPARDARQAVLFAIQRRAKTDFHVKELATWLIRIDTRLYAWSMLAAMSLVEQLAGDYRFPLESVLSAIKRWVELQPSIVTIAEIESARESMEIIYDESRDPDYDAASAVEAVGLFSRSIENYSSIREINEARARGVVNSMLVCIADGPSSYEAEVRAYERMRERMIDAIPRLPVLE